MAPYEPEDTLLQNEIATLREAGDTVIVDLPGHEEHRNELSCRDELVLRNGSWIVEARKR